MSASATVSSSISLGFSPSRMEQWSPHLKATTRLFSYTTSVDTCVAGHVFVIFCPDDSPWSRVAGVRVSDFRMTSTYLTNWLYVWLFIAAGGGLVVLILLFSKLINPSHLTPEKLAPYECGIPPVGNPWAPFAVRYLSLIHISEPTRLGMISYAVFCLKKKKQSSSKL